ncbi:MAG TPA: hypothetical protein VJJ22_01300 [Candidatus Paceibacterota bacterium]
MGEEEVLEDEVKPIDIDDEDLGDTPLIADDEDDDKVDELGAD